MKWHSTIFFNNHYETYQNVGVHMWLHDYFISGNKEKRNIKTENWVEKQILNRGKCFSLKEKSKIFSSSKSVSFNKSLTTDKKMLQVGIEVERGAVRLRECQYKQQNLREMWFRAL